MASEKYTGEVEVQRHFKGPDNKASMWMRENVGECSWEDGLKATIDSAFGSNIIVYFEGDDTFECYVVTAAEIAQTARRVRDEFKAKQEQTVGK